MPGPFDQQGDGAIFRTDQMEGSGEREPYPPNPRSIHDREDPVHLAEFAASKVAGKKLPIFTDWAMI